MLGKKLKRKLIISLAECQCFQIERVTSDPGLSSYVLKHPGKYTGVSFRDLFSVWQNPASAAEHLPHCLTPHTELVCFLPSTCYTGQSPRIPYQVHPWYKSGLKRQETKKWKIIIYILKTIISVPIKECPSRVIFTGALSSTIKQCSPAHCYRELEYRFSNINAVVFVLLCFFHKNGYVIFCIVTQPNIAFINLSILECIKIQKKNPLVYIEAFSILKWRRKFQDYRIIFYKCCFLALDKVFNDPKPKRAHV